MNPAPRANPPAAATDAGPWHDALLALSALAVDPVLLRGVWLRADHGPVRDAWLAQLAKLDLKKIRIPNNVDDERLLGGLDLSASLATGQPVLQPGLLAQAHGQLVVLPMAERLNEATLSRLLQVQDKGEVHAVHTGRDSSRQSAFGIVALDESLDDEPPINAALRERMGLWLDLRALRRSDLDGLSPLPEQPEAVQQHLQQARDKLAQLSLSDEQLRALCLTAQVLGVDSLRAPYMAARLACVLAALQARNLVDDADLTLAAKMVIAPRATRLPPPPEPPAAEESPPEPSLETPPEPLPDPTPDTPPEPGPPPDQPPDQPPIAEPQQPSPLPGDLPDLVLQAALASLPADMLQRLALGTSKGTPQRSGGQGAARQSRQRGRPLAPRPGQPRQGARLHVLATLRAAVPRQKLRQQPSGRIAVRTEDFHLHRYQQTQSTCLIFAVDASGSAALARLAEAKGAVELMLQQSYARRDQVCVVAFRGQKAEVLLAPTRSLVRAKRALGGLPGGGGTPVATALKLCQELAQGQRRLGVTPILVVLCDGRANVTLQGVGGREQAMQDALAWAQSWRSGGSAAVWLDTSPLPDVRAQQLAKAMGARYVPMPVAQAQRMAGVMQDAVAASRH